MSRQLNLRVSNEFAERLERLSKRTGRTMAVVLESLGTPALEAAEADSRFEADAFAAWEEYELTGEQVSAEAVETMFSRAAKRAKASPKTTRRAR